MANENENTTVETTDTSDYQEYIDQINELKRNTVSRTEYDKIREENRTLLSNLVNGTGTTVEQTHDEPKESLADLRTRVFTNPKNDLDYVAGILEIREWVMAEGEKDPFVNDNGRYQATEDDYKAGQRLAEGLKHCVEIADGDNDVFIQEITRITRDTPITPKKSNKRR